MRPAHVFTRALLCTLAALPFAASAQDLLIRNATVHTVTERGTLERADVLVRNGHIAAVGNGLAAAGATVVDANGRALTPGLFGGITALGVVEVSLEKSTVDNDPHAAEKDKAAEPRPEFDVTLSFNPDSAVIGVNRVEGISYAMIAPGDVSGDTVIAGQGAVARLDGRADAMVAPSRTLFANLNAGVSRASQFMLLEQATREAKATPQMRDADFRLLTPTGREVLARYLSGGRIAFSVDRATTSARRSRSRRNRGRARSSWVGRRHGRLPGNWRSRRCRSSSIRSWTCPTRSTRSARRSTTPRACTRPASASPSPT